MLTMTDTAPSPDSSYFRIRAFVLFAIVFLAQWLLLFSAHVPEWDGAYYYAMARSLAFDQDLHLENDLTAAYPYVNDQYRASHLDRLDERRTVTGRIDVPFAVGVSILWSGVLVVMRPLLPLFIETTGPVTGYEWPFIVTVATFSALCGAAAFWLGYVLSRKVVEEKWALAAAITLMFTTPLLFYQYRNPFYSHTTSALTVGLVVYAWWHIRQRPLTWKAGVLLGGLIGISTLVRWQHWLYLALPALSALWDWYVLPRTERSNAFKRLLGYGTALGITALLIFFVQMVVWKLFYGSWIEVPQGSSFMVWVPLFLRPILFSPYRGILFWMPVAIFSFIGLLHLARQSPRSYVPLIVALLLEVYINSSTPDWFGGGGFGPRRFTSDLILLVLGYAGFLSFSSHQLSRLKLPQGITNLLVLLPGIVLTWQHWILLRYGLPEKIGGRNLSMQPDFRWQESTWGEFGRQIMAHGGDLWSRPRDFLVFSHSPLALWQETGEFPWQLVGVMVMIMLVAAAVWGVLFLIRKQRLRPTL